MAEPREPVDGAGPVSMAEGRVLARGGAVELAEGLPTVPEGRVRWAPGRTDGSGPRMTPGRFDLPAVGVELRTLDRAPDVGPAGERRSVELRVGAAVRPRSPSVGRRVVAVVERLTPGLVVPAVGRSTPRGTLELVLGGAVRAAVGRVRAGVEVAAPPRVRVGVEVVALGRVRTGVWVVPVLVRVSLVVVTGVALPVVPTRSRVVPLGVVPTRDPAGVRTALVRPPSTAAVLRPALPAAVVVRDATERLAADGVAPVLAAVTEPAPVRRGFSLKVVASGETTATVRP